MRNSLLSAVIVGGLLAVMLVWLLSREPVPPSQGATPRGVSTMGPRKSQTTVRHSGKSRSGTAPEANLPPAAGDSAGSATDGGQPQAAGTEADTAATPAAKPDTEAKDEAEEGEKPGGTPADATANGETAPKPSLRPVRRQSQELLVEQAYGDLFAKLDLSDKELAQLKKDLLLKPFVNGGIDRDVTPGPVAVPAGVTPATDANSLENTLLRLLGPERYKIYQDYETNLPSRLVVNDYQAQLTPAGVPLSKEQQAKFITAVIDARNTLRAPAVTAPPADLAKATDILAANIANQKLVNEAILKAATGFLTPEQVQVVQQLQEQQAAGQQRALAATQELFRGAGQAVPAAQ